MDSIWIEGGKPLVELMYCDFMGRAGDEIFNQISKWQSMSAGILKMPLTLRVSVGNKYGAQHSQDWTAMVNHIPGLKVYYPATTNDAKGMLNLALAGTDPVIFFESQKTYGVGELFEEGGVPEGYFETEEGEPAVRTQGKDLTLITLGPVLYSGMKVVEEMKEKACISDDGDRDSLDGDYNAPTSSSSSSIELFLQQSHSYWIYLRLVVAKALSFDSFKQVNEKLPDLLLSLLQICDGATCNGSTNTTYRLDKRS